MLKRNRDYYEALRLSRGRVPLETIASYKCKAGTKHFLEEVAFMHVLCMRDVLGHAFTLRLAKNVYKTFCTGPYDVILSELKKIDIILLHSLGETDCELALNGALSDMCSGVRQVVGLLRLWFDFVTRDGDIVAMGQLHQILHFASRITLRDNPNALEESIRKYVDTMKHVGLHDNVLATERMKEWVRDLFRDDNPWDLFSPHHSAGAVTEHIKKPEELWAKTPGPVACYMLSQSGIQSYPQPRFSQTRRDTVQTGVPKGVDSIRIVEPEPTELRFCQHGVAEAVNSVLDRRFSDHYDRRNSGAMNRYMAYEGSISRLFDTLDLSSASDSVRWSLVKSLLELLPKWQRIIGLVRTTKSTWLNGEVHPKIMVGSMGNPITFPLEVVTFGSLIWEAGNREWDRIEPFLGITTLSEKAHQRSCFMRELRFWVYGDDIIVPHWLTETLLEVLEEFGFLPNVDKSYIGNCPFRESCGGDFIDGEDITPVRISRTWPGSFVRTTREYKPNRSKIGKKGKKPSRRKLTSQQTISLVDMANRAQGRLPLVRLYCINRLEEENVKIPFSRIKTGSLVVLAEKPTNRHLLRSEELDDLQYRQVKCVVPKLKRRRLAEDSDDCLYWHWLQAHSSTPKGPNPLDYLRGAGVVSLPDDLALKRMEDGRLTFSEETLIRKLAEKGEIGLAYRWVSDTYTEM